MSVYEKDNKFLSYLIILISLFIIVLFTKDQFNVIQENLDSKSSYGNELKLKREKLNSLNEIKNELYIKDSEEKSKKSKDVEKYSFPFSENEMIDYFYWYVESLDPTSNELKIKSITFSEWIKNEIWFKESNINLNVTVVDKNAMIKFLDFLIDDKSKYKFFINNFSYPNDQKEWWFNLSVPLKLFYR